MTFWFILEKVDIESSNCNLFSPRLKTIITFEHLARSMNCEAGAIEVEFKPLKKEELVDG